MRKKNQIPRHRPNFAIIVDGECEVWYIQMLKRNEQDIYVNLRPEIPQKKSLSAQFEMVKNLSQDYDRVFWIIDFDSIRDETSKAKSGSKTATQLFKEYKSIIKKDYKNITIIINNPCLEFWFLLHFKSTNRFNNNCADVVRELRPHLSDYEKSQNYYTKEGNDIYKRLKHLLIGAISNAERFNSGYIDHSSTSTSQMNFLFKELRLA